MNILEEIDLKNKHRLELCEELLEYAEKWNEQNMASILRGQILALTTMLQDREAKP